MIARKRFGQHFLEPAWVAKVVAAIHPTLNDEFVEIGPGRAALTTPLAASAKRVVAFEIDRDLAVALRGRFSEVELVIETSTSSSDSRRGQSALQRRVTDSVQANRTVRERGPDRRRDADAAA